MTKCNLKFIMLFMGFQNSYGMIKYIPKESISTNRIQPEKKNENPLKVEKIKIEEQIEEQQFVAQDTQETKTPEELEKERQDKKQAKKERQKEKRKQLKMEKEEIEQQRKKEEEEENEKRNLIIEIKKLLSDFHLQVKKLKTDAEEIINDMLQPKTKRYHPLKSLNITEDYAKNHNNFINNFCKLTDIKAKCLIHIIQTYLNKRNNNDSKKEIQEKYNSFKESINKNISEIEALITTKINSYETKIEKKYND